MGVKFGRKRKWDFIGKPVSFFVDFTYTKKNGGCKMNEDKEQQVYVKVKDFAGNEYVCPIDALKNMKEVPEDVLDNCVDDATVGRYAGNIKIVK